MIEAGDGFDNLFGDGNADGGVANPDGADIMRGGPGRDVLDGRGGVDQLFGETGRDDLVGAAGDDRD